MGRVRWTKGDLLLLPSGIWHRYRPLSTSHWVENWFNANGEYLHRLRTKGILPRTALIRKLQDSDPCKSAMDRLSNAAKKNSLLLATMAMEVFSHALEDIEISHRGFDCKSTENLLIDDIVEFIWLNCHRQLSVGFISREFGMSRRSLERQFSSCYKRSITEEIHWSRLQRAKLMLAEGDMSVKEIDYAVGCGGARRLSAMFSRSMDQTPTDCRRSVLQPLPFHRRE